mmetsp:Transcript_8354/g.25934  ORF Transcript_8354/g.25934 Transcript_8354/m.25934 type:complete len:373 (-) Transcript_8354:228-1346(-)
MYGTTAKMPLLGELPQESFRKTREEVDRAMEYPVFLWTTLVRFSRKTLVLQWTFLAAAVVYGYALFFGMYVNGWSFTQSTYFFSYTIATIGYTYSGKTTTSAIAMLSVYILTSVFVCGLLLGLFIAAITDATEASVATQLREERQEHLSGDESRPLRRSPRRETRVEARARIELDVAVQTIWLTFYQMLAVTIIGVAAVIFFDRGIHLNSAVLFILETITTVGYGTVYLDTTMAKWFNIVYIVPGCLAWGRFVAAVSRYPLALRRYQELAENIDSLQAEERRGLSAFGGRELLEGHRRLVRLSTGDDDAEAAAAAEDKPAGSDPASLRREDFVIQWLLATKQVHLHDVLDAHELYAELKHPSRPAHAPTPML